MMCEKREKVLLGPTALSAYPNNPLILCHEVMFKNVQRGCVVYQPDHPLARNPYDTLYSEAMVWHYVA
jgi:hypothetical protein